MKLLEWQSMIAYLCAAEGLLHHVREHGALGHLDPSSKSKIGKHGHAAARKEKVLQLEISMGDVVRVHVLQSVYQSREVVFRLIVRVWSLESLAQVRLDGTIGRIAHYDVGVVVCLDHIVCHDDIRVLHVLCDEHFVLQALACPLLFTGVLQVEDLDGAVVWRVL